jgi:hypothetical protein
MVNVFQPGPNAIKLFMAGSTNIRNKLGILPLAGLSSLVYLGKEPTLERST